MCKSILILRLLIPEYSQSTRATEKAGLISHISGKQTYSYLCYYNVHMQGTTWCSPHLQLLKVMKHDSPFFSLKFSTRHRPNVKSNCSSLNALRAVYGNFFEAESCLKSCLIIPNCFFPDSQPANKQYLLFFFVVG